MNPAVTCTVSPVSTRSAVTDHLASSDDQSAATMRCRKWIFWSTPVSAAVSVMYCRIDGPSAMVLSPSHGRNEYPRVYMSESDRMPG